jgi:hypothetical protein
MLSRTERAGQAVCDASTASPIRSRGEYGRDLASTAADALVSAMVIASRPLSAMNGGWKRRRPN